MVHLEHKIMNRTTSWLIAGLLFLQLTEILACGRTKVSKKKGISIGYGKLDCPDFQLIVDVPWWYDWRNDLDWYKAKFHCGGVDNFLNRYVPMTWGRKSVEELRFPVVADAILGFNEPNHKKQSNLPAHEAAALWKTIEQKSGRKLLVSPSAAKCKGEECLSNETEWFDNFFGNCSGCRVDYLAVHNYVCSADSMIVYLEHLSQRYGKKVWLTEFACPYTFDVKEQLIFMQDLLPKLEAADFIYRYSWFTARKHTDGFVTRSANLFQENSTTLTELGYYYIHFQPQASSWSFEIL